MSGSAEWLAMQEEIGVSMAKLIYVNTTVSVGFAAVQLFIFSHIFMTFLETPRAHRQGRIPYIATSFTIFVLFSIMAASDAYHTFELTFRAKSGLGYAILHTSKNEFAWSRGLSTGAMISFVTVADGLLVYRCYAIWRDRWWVCIPTFLAYLLSTALFIAASATPTGKLTSELLSASAMCCTLVNILATFCIAFRLVRANRALQRAMPERKDRLLSTVATMVVESALPPAVFGLLYAVLTLYPWKADTVASAERGLASNFILSMLFWGFVALSPQLIIFRVTTGRSFTHPAQAHSDGTRTSPPLSNPLMFARSQGMESIFLSQSPPGDHRHHGNQANVASDSRDESEKKVHASV